MPNPVSPSTDNLQFWNSYFEWQQMVMQADLQGAKFSFELVDKATGQKQTIDHVHIAPNPLRRN